MNYSASREEAPKIQSCKVMRLIPPFYQDQGYTLQNLDSLHFIEYNVTILHGDIERELKPGDWIFTEAGTRFHYLKAEGGNQHFYHFKPRRSKRGPKITIPAVGHLGSKYSEYMRLSSQTIADFRLGKNLKHNRLADYGLLQLIQRIERDFVLTKQDPTTSKTNRSDVAVEEITALLLAELSSPINVAELCKTYMISHNHLNRCFHQKFGMSVSEFHMLQRLNFAKELIEGSALAFKVIAGFTGFTDSHHFNKKIRQHFGCSPSQMRDSAQNT